MFNFEWLMTRNKQIQSAKSIETQEEISRKYLFKNQINLNISEKEKSKLRLYVIFRDLKCSIFRFFQFVK